MQNKIEQVSEQVLEEIKPTAADRKKMQAIARQLEVKVSAACEEFGLPAVVRLEGSLAKDTWLKGDPDIDVFIRLPPSIPRKSLGEISLRVAKKATEGARQVERFAEHPYLEAFIDGIRVNVVPCYESKPGEWLSATDRTPYHTDYINTHLKANQKNEVRLLKKFMKGIGVYGAEIKVGGFSGYLCELIILHYGSFAKALQAFMQQTPKRVVDIEGFYVDRHRELELLFADPLVIVDPVDKARNVASAVQPLKLYTFVAASRAFLKTPKKAFFNPPKTKPFDAKTLKANLDRRGSQLLFLTFDGVQAVPDVLWGQLHRTRRALHQLLDLSEFKVLRSVVWSKEEGDVTVFVFELETLTLPLARKHLGPPLQHEKECESFLQKYLSTHQVLAGPYIEPEGRWAVQVQRKFTDATELFRAKLKTGGRDVGVAELVSGVLKQKFEILVCSEIVKLYADHSEFAVFLTEFLSGKPLWLTQEVYKPS